MTAFVTLIEGTQYPLAKTIYQEDGQLKGGKPEYYNKYFNFHHHNLTGLRDVHELLTNIADYTHYGVCLGELIDKVLTHGRRRHVEKEEPRLDGETPTLRDAPSAVLCLDIDDIPFPDGVVATDLAACGRAVRDRVMPAAFNGRAMVVQATSSHGLKPGMRLRLWFWLSRAITLAEKKAWLGRIAGIDDHLFLPSHIVYCVSPTLIDVVDPLPTRMAFVDGYDTVPAPVPAALAAAMPIKIKRTAVPPSGHPAPAEAIAAVLQMAIDKVAKAAIGEKHDVVRDTAFWLGGMTDAQWDYEAVAQRLVAAMDTLTPDKHYKTALESLAHGALKPIAVPGTTTMGALPSGTAMPPDTETSNAKDAKKPMSQTESLITELAGMSVTADGYVARRKEIARTIQRSVTETEALVRSERKASAQKRAKDAAPTDAERATVQAVVEAYNDQYAIVLHGGKTFVMRQSYDDLLDRQYYDFIPIRSFEEALLNQTTVVGDKLKQNVDIWRRHNDCRSYLGGVVFDPAERSIRPDRYNMWTGFAVQPEQGDWTLFKRHLLDVICAGNPEHYDWLLNWLAHMFQQPGEHADVAVVLRGRKGIGKGLFADAISRIVGRHGLVVNDPGKVTGRFNEHLQDCLFLFADEAFFAGDKTAGRVLNTLITNATLTIEGKGKSVVQTKNYMHLLMASNADWIIPASDDERRYTVFDVLDTYRGQPSYFGPIFQQMMHDGGDAAMLYDLLHRDISKFNHRQALDTDGLRAQKLESLDDVHRWWLDCLYVGAVSTVPGVKTEWPEWLSTTFLYDSYMLFADRYGVKYKQCRVHFGRFMTKMAEASRRDRITGYKFAYLDEARRLFTDTTGVLVDWDVD